MRTRVIYRCSRCRKNFKERPNGKHSCRVKPTCKVIVCSCPTCKQKAKFKMRHVCQTPAQKNGAASFIKVVIPAKEYCRLFDHDLSKGERIPGTYRTRSEFSRGNEYDSYAKMAYWEVKKICRCCGAKFEEREEKCLDSSYG